VNQLIIYIIGARKKTEKMYEKIKDIHAIFTTNGKLQEIHHKVNTNLSVSASFVVAKFLPKHKHYGTTIVDKSRVSLAVCIISNGYTNTMGEVPLEPVFLNTPQRCAIAQIL
jgi:hypothetical protein